ncbi:hypothetical protein VM1G_00663 [Cytospora mali]|uniref:Uncharacterized protein n=1 Tax=Cytospora mali TaxID=578113 RepID=A0A194VMF5_CYTMA|nr:hypothetical protein VM1G_00663 [Valsa mali]
MPRANRLLRCFVIDANDTPLGGLHITLTCLSRTNHTFDGYTNPQGLICYWHSAADNRFYWIPATDGTRWRITVDIFAAHPFHRVSFDFYPRSQDGTNITMVIGRASFSTYNGRPLVSQPTPPLPSALLVDNQSDSGVGNLDSQERPLLASSQTRRQGSVPEDVPQQHNGDW